MNVWGDERLRWWMSEVMNVWGDECPGWWMSDFRWGWWMSELMNVWGDECRGDECRTIFFSTRLADAVFSEAKNQLVLDGVLVRSWSCLENCSQSICRPRTTRKLWSSLSTTGSSSTQSRFHWGYLLSTSRSERETMEVLNSPEMGELWKVCWKTG